MLVFSFFLQRPFCMFKKHPTIPILLTVGENRDFQPFPSCGTHKLITRILQHTQTHIIFSAELPTTEKVQFGFIHPRRLLWRLFVIF